MHIILDFDNTIAKTDRAMFDFYREETNDYSTEYDEKLVNWNMETLCPNWTLEQRNDCFIKEGFFKHLKLYDNVIDTLKLLKEDGHYLHIASCHRVEGAEFKKKFIEENLPMIDEVTIIPIGDNCPHLDKSSIYGDIILDDSLSALQTANTTYKICFGNWEWNKDWKGLRVDNWMWFYALTLLMNDIENRMAEMDV